MIRLLSRVPRWLAVALALVTAAGLFIIVPLSRSLHGWELALTLSLGVLFTATAVGLPELSRWQAQQEARLKVGLELDPRDLTVPAYADDERAIESLVDAEEAACLASVPRERPARRPSSFDAEAVAKKLDAGDTDHEMHGDLKGLTLGECMRLIEKEESGAELTAEEKRRIFAAHEAMAPVFSAVKAITVFSFLSIRPDTRTLDQYRDEVGRHLSNYREFLSKQLRRRYVTGKIGHLKLTVVNPTDRVFEDVQIEIYLPGRVRALDPSELVEPSTRPGRPRPFGQGTRMSLLPNISIPGECSVRIPGALGPRPRPRIDNSTSAKVTYPSVLLRPRSQMRLDEVVLVVEERPGSVIAGTWEATATNAEGRVKGGLAVRVATAPLAVRELLADWSDLERDS